MKTPAKDPGFTVLELCIVVGVVTVLFVLLLPSLGRSRDLAGRAACLSNLRGWAIAIAGYTADESGLLPRNEVLNDPGNLNSGTKLFFHLLAPYGGYSYPLTKEALFRATMLACPAEKDFPKTPYYHYAMNIDLNHRIQVSNGRGAAASVRLQNLQNRATYVLMSDSFGSCVLYTQTRDKMNDFTDAFRRHNGAPNFLYADGHIQSFTEEIVGYGDPDGMSDRWKNMWFANGIQPAKR